MAQLSENIQKQKIRAILTPVKQIAQSEEKILAEMGSLVAFINLLILGSTFLSVLTTFIAIVTERKKEIALKKSFGCARKSYRERIFS